ncbi:MAG: ATP-binding cassette domain-containing protein [Sinobacteraceae bacterium]|nr:ATP-binding cassette domain-containing protein [Nevskiaceae bacterium]
MRELALADALLRRAVAADASPLRTLPLAVESLHYRAGGRALLTDLSFVVRPRTCNVILGPNGAGKSLLLRLCHGLLHPDAGQVTWNGLAPARARLHHAMIFQHPLMLRRSVAANVAYPLAVRRVPRGERRRLVEEALEATDLTRLARVPATRLSGGEQQRVAIARAWVVRPEAMLLDEPSANLDPRSTLAVETLIRTMRMRGATVLLTTHDLAQARRLAERVLFLHDGRLIEDAPAETFFDCPASAEARAFLGGELLT